MLKKKILFIIGPYPHYKSANVLCDEKIIFELINTNLYDVHILCSRLKFQSKEEIKDGVTIHRFSKGFWWDIYIWATRQKNSWKIKIIFFINKIFLRIKEIITIPFFPIYQPFTSMLYYFKACHLVKKENFDMVIVEHNGIDTLMAGYLLKKKFLKIKFMPIFWDPLSCGIPVKYLPIWYSKSKKIKLEEKIFRIADSIIIMQSYEQKLKQLYFNTHLWEKIKILDIPSFARNQKENILVTKNNNITVCFAGSISNRNIEFLAGVLEQTKLKNIKLLVVAQELYKTRIDRLKEQYSNLNIQFESYMPHEELLKLFEEVDFFVNLGVNSNTMVASKIFEYMSFGKPIISTYRQDDDANIQYLRKYPLSCFIDERNKKIEEQAQFLKKFIEKNENERVCYEEIAAIFYKNTPQAYVEEITRLLGK